MHACCVTARPPAFLLRPPPRRVRRARAIESEIGSWFIVACGTSSRGRRELRSGEGNSHLRMSAARLPPAAVARRLSAAPARLLRRTTPGACGRIAASAGPSQRLHLVADILARGAVAAAATSTTSNDGPGKCFLLATGMLTLGGSTSGDETVECAPPKWSNDHQRLLDYSTDASGTEATMDDQGSLEPHRTLHPHTARGDIPHDTNQSMLLQQQLGIGSYPHPLSRPPAPYSQFAVQPPHRPFNNAVGLAGLQYGTGLMQTHQPSHFGQYHQPNFATTLYSSQFGQSQPTLLPSLPAEFGQCSQISTVSSNNNGKAMPANTAENCTLEESLEKTLYHELNWTPATFCIPCTLDPTSDDLVATDLCKFLPDTPDPFYHSGAKRVVSTLFFGLWGDTSLANSLPHSEIFSPNRTTRGST